MARRNVSSLFADRSCVVCRETFDGGPAGAYVRHCCRTCGHPLDDHARNTLKCRTCGHACGIDCRPEWMRARDPWPVALAPPKRKRRRRRAA